MSYRFVDTIRAGTSLSCSNAVYKPVWRIVYHCWVYSEKTPDDGQRHCPKQAEFHAKNKFMKWVHLVGFIINKYVTMPGHMNVKLITTSSLHLVLFLSCVEYWQSLTLRLLISYIYMELLVKPEMLTSYIYIYIYIHIYGPTFGNAETVSFYLLHNVSSLNQCREVSCVTFVCKHFSS